MLNGIYTFLFPVVCVVLFIGGFMLNDILGIALSVLCMLGLYFFIYLHDEVYTLYLNPFSEEVDDKED